MSVHPNLFFGHDEVSNSEIASFSQDQGNQGILQIDTDIAEKGLFLDGNPLAPAPVYVKMMIAKFHFAIFPLTKGHRSVIERITCSKIEHNLYFSY